MLTRTEKILERDKELDRRCERYLSVLGKDAEFLELIQEAHRSLVNKEYVIVELYLVLLAEELRGGE